MHPLGVAARHPEQARDRIFGEVHQTGGGTHPTPFAQMVDHGNRLLLWDFRVEQGRVTSLGKLLAARPAAQQPDPISAVYFAHRKIVLTCEPKALAFGIDTR